MRLRVYKEFQIFLGILDEILEFFQKFQLEILDGILEFSREFQNFKSVFQHFMIKIFADFARNSRFQFQIYQQPNYLTSLVFYLLFVFWIFQDVLFKLVLPIKLDFQPKNLRIYYFIFCDVFFYIIKNSKVHFWLNTCLIQSDFGTF